jgi:hypothetical protein
MKKQWDYSSVRGCNYFQSTGTRGLNMWGEVYDPAVVERELGYAKKIGLNSARVFLNYLTYRENPGRFIKNLKHFVKAAWERGISTNPTIWAMMYFDDDELEYVKIHGFNSDENAPVPHALLPKFWPAGEKYCDDLIAAIGHEPGLIFWDIMNEPTWNPYLLYEKNSAEKARRLELVWEFVRHFCKYMKQKDPDNDIGVGNTFIFDTEPSKTAELVDIIVFHDYYETRARVDEVNRMAIELSKKYGKPVVNNETACLCRSNPYDIAIETANKYKIGWYVFELMIHGYWQGVHGIFYPDGTVRDPSIVAACMGIFRNRTATSIYPDVNREGHGDKAIAFAKTALDKRACANDLLEAAEYIANLLEGGELVPMACPPSAKIAAYRRNPEKNVAEIRAFLHGLIEMITKACEIVSGDKITADKPGITQTFGMWPKGSDFITWQPQA